MRDSWGGWNYFLNICLEIFDWKYAENNAWWLAWGGRSNLSNICFKRFCLKICWKLWLSWVWWTNFLEYYFPQKFLLKICWNYACSLTWGGWKELDGVKRSNYRPPTTFLVNPLKDRRKQIPFSWALLIFSKYWPLPNRNVWVFV